ncbi:MAG TPA: zinc-ribbon domain-containing protein [Candidatus Paceibacterota bacterium]|nr:zinc-ribbon domain-containing protein [Candidatus Paceibacterota bacterium]
MFCENCGNKIISDEKFCTKCGQGVNLPKNENSSPLNVVKTGGVAIKKLLKICLWLALIGFGIWLIIALGPLWIIAIILGLILYVLANR